ncbi:hypothetical protein NL676_036107 [Syzygium grande]|nr:hypothetical protein NL676_036107 [Syzygium grande]
MSAAAHERRPSPPTTEVRLLAPTPTLPPTSDVRRCPRATSVASHNRGPPPRADADAASDKRRPTDRNSLSSASFRMMIALLAGGRE